MAFVRAASLDEVPEGESLGVEVAGRRVCLVRVEGEVYALEDRCSHREFPLAGGEVDPVGCTITCEWHGAEFDLRTGQPQCPPATRAVPVYAVRVEGDEVWVELG
jgi:3-phenylpropionate/trans-cinnamate dioxygenase ferredoxin subunit